jgi:putative alpha-1,2-mannosidase
MQDGFQEGNAAQYTWMVPQDLAGLIRAMGGGHAAARRLDTFFTKLNAGPGQPYAWQGNEPGLGTPWIYDSAGEPWQAQALVQRITGQLYALTPGGEPGNDDLGALSSWYVWATLGLYPQTPGVPMLVLGTPQFPEAVIHGAYGQLVIAASGAGDGYVRGLTVNGAPSERTYVAVNGTRELDFALSKTPDTSWGSAPGDAPPSFGLPRRQIRTSGRTRSSSVLRRAPASIRVCRCFRRCRGGNVFLFWPQEHASQRSGFGKKPARKANQMPLPFVPCI